MAELLILNDKLYSIDMMAAYVNLFETTKIRIKILDYEHNLYNLTWWSFSENRYISPMEVINNPDKDNDHKINYDGIKNADLKYEILLNEQNQIINGYHRLSKAYMENRKEISAFIIPNDIVNKCKLSDKSTEDEQMKYTLMLPHKYIEMFIERIYR